MRVLRHLIMACVLVGCVSAPVGTPLVRHRIGEAPSLRTATSRSVGEVIYETFNYDEWSGAQLAEPVLIRVLAAEASLGPRDALIATEEAGETVYCTDSPVLRVMGQPPTSRICLADRDGDARFETWRAPGGPPARLKWAALRAPVGFKVGPSMAPTGGGYKYELLYQGISGNVIRLLYREYVDNLVRPAFQQDLSYTLSPQGPTEIAFRGSRILVHSADNSAMNYELISGLSK